MDQRNALCMHQMLNLQLGQGVSQFHPDNWILAGNVADYTNRSIHPLLLASGNIAEQGLLFRDYPDSTFYGNQYNGFQNFHAVPNLTPSAGAPPNFYAPCFPSSSSRNFPAPRNNVPSEHLPSATGMDELGRNNQVVDSVRGFGKRKIVEVPAGNQHNFNGSADYSSSLTLLSQNCGLPQWEQSYEPALNLYDSTNFDHSEHQERGNIQTEEGSHRTMSRSSVVSHHPESAYYLHPNYALQAVHMGQSLHPASNVWMAQYGTENSIGDGAGSNWNYSYPMTYLPGRCLHSGAVELSNMGLQAFSDASSSANAAIIFNPTSLPSFHQHVSPVPAIQLQNYGHQVQMQAPSYQHPFNNLHPINVNPSSHGLNSGSRFPHFPSNAEQIFRPRHTHHVAPDISHRNVGILSSEDAAAMDISRFYGVGNVIDQHQDMRLDIDEMSYEELLDLEEQIGDVKTGLTEECIMENLKTSVHNSQAAFLTSDMISRFSPEAEPCTICQVEYEENEIIGTLDCGHNYHGECIKKWLLVKNLCPICKKTALARDISKG